MAARVSDHRLLWMSAGLVAGLCLSYFWPHEPARAMTSDRADKYAMLTVPVRDITIGGVRETAGGVFVLDFLTGRLQGAVLNNRFGKFTNTYFRDVAADFKVDINAGQPQYTLSTVAAQLPSKGNVTWANSVIFVGELRSGQVGAYGFSYNDVRAPVNPAELIPLDSFQFREPMAN